jgi:hypothetical protein
MGDLFMKKLNKFWKELFYSILCLLPVFLLIAILMIRSYYNSAEEPLAETQLPLENPTNREIAKRLLDRKRLNINISNLKYLDEEFPEEWKAWKKFKDSLGVSVIPSDCYWPIGDIVLPSTRFFIDKGKGRYQVFFSIMLVKQDNPEIPEKLSKWGNFWASKIATGEYYMRNSFEENVRRYYAWKAFRNCPKCTDKWELVGEYNKVNQEVKKVLEQAKKKSKMAKRDLEYFYEEEYYFNVLNMWIEHQVRKFKRTNPYENL